MELGNIDLNLLVVFEAIYSGGSISRAGKQLGMSQPAVSNALARLRELMDDALFVRTRHGVDPTLKARRLIGPVREALNLIEGQLKIGRQIDLASYKRLFRILMFDPLEPIMLPPVLRQIADQGPGVAIECVRATADFAEGLRGGTIDLACYAYPVNAPDIVVVPIISADTVVIARRGHPDIGKTLDVATYSALGHVTLVPALRAMANLDKDIAIYGLTRRAVYMVNKTWSVAPIVARTDLLGTLPRWVALAVARNFDIEIYDMPVKVPEHAVYMLWHQKSTSDPGHQWLRETMLAAMREKAQLSENVTSLALANMGNGPPRSSAVRPKSPRIG
jgi:DNA-binding transcriptional LysR family regulator